MDEGQHIDWDAGERPVSFAQLVEDLDAEEPCDCRSCQCEALYQARVYREVYLRELLGAVPGLN